MRVATMSDGFCMDTDELGHLPNRQISRREHKNAHSRQGRTVMTRLMAIWLYRRLCPGHSQEEAVTYTSTFDMPIDTSRQVEL
jgi:hypothetical protein